ncbi:MAG: DUF420 domain-containing protein [Planctomycetaceae bacterium]|nr:DUF420 domain-containing protein [Planctomycetaceae bacterium]
MSSVRFWFCGLTVLGFASFAIAQEIESEPKSADVLLEPDQELPPFVQLEPDKAPVPWDVNKVGEFQLLDQNGNSVTRGSLLGKPWVANFVFARCTFQCPQTCKKIMDLSQELDDVDVRFVTITVDPEYDTVEIMSEFASIWGADPERWIFATGDPQEVWKLIREGFKVSAWENVGTDRIPGMEFAHDNNLIHVDAEGNILGRYNSAVDTELVTLKRVLRGRIETPEKHRPATLEAIAALDSLKAAVQESQPEIIEQEKAKLAAEVLPDPLEKLPGWAQRLPSTNAMLNGLATLMLLVGFAAIKAKRVALHKQMMLMSFAVSVIFLGCYLTYHWALHEYAGVRGKPFSGTGVIRPIYFSILISHVILAATVPVLAIVTIVKGLRENWVSHRKWAKVTFPIWLYVSVTGVIIYWMLYRL